MNKVHSEIFHDEGIGNYLERDYETGGSFGPSSSDQIQKDSKNNKRKIDESFDDREPIKLIRTDRSQGIRESMLDKGGIICKHDQIK